MASEEPPDLTTAPAAGDEGRRSTLFIAAAAGATAMSFNVWYPFMPLYALELGAKSDADAVAWVALAITMQGVTRLASSAIWGVLSDRWGRKLMLLRALYLASLTFMFAAVAQAPWHLAVATACQGLFSGFIPASVSLVSVLVPDHRLNRSLSTLTGAQYLGTTTGPALGALLALLFSFRTTIVVASVVPLITATMVLLWVPRDRVAPRRTAAGEKTAIEPFRWSPQFALGVGALFCVYAMNELIRLSTPIALKAIKDGADVAGVSGITFSLGGLVSALGVLFLAPIVFRPGRVRAGFRRRLCLRRRRLPAPGHHGLRADVHRRLPHDRPRDLLPRAGDQHPHCQQRHAVEAWHRLWHRRHGPGALVRRRSRRRGAVRRDLVSPRLRDHRRAVPRAGRRPV